MIYFILLITLSYISVVVSLTLGICNPIIYCGINTFYVIIVFKVTVINLAYTMKCHN